MEYQCNLCKGVARVGGHVSRAACPHPSATGLGQPICALCSVIFAVGTVVFGEPGIAPQLLGPKLYWTAPSSVNASFTLSPVHAARFVALGWFVYACTSPSVGAIQRVLSAPWDPQSNSAQLTSVGCVAVVYNQSLGAPVVPGVPIPLRNSSVRFPFTRGHLVVVVRGTAPACPCPARSYSALSAVVGYTVSPPATAATAVCVDGTMKSYADCVPGLPGPVYVDARVRPMLGFWIREVYPTGTPASGDPYVPLVGFYWRLVTDNTTGNLFRASESVQWTYEARPALTTAIATSSLSERQRYRVHMTLCNAVGSVSSVVRSPWFYVLRSPSGASNSWVDVRAVREDAVVRVEWRVVGVDDSFLPLDMTDPPVMCTWTAGTRRDSGLVNTGRVGVRWEDSGASQVHVPMTTLPVNHPVVFALACVDGFGRRISGVSAPFMVEALWLDAQAAAPVRVSVVHLVLNGSIDHGDTSERRVVATPPLCSPPKSPPARVTAWLLPSNGAGVRVAWDHTRAPGSSDSRYSPVGQNVTFLVRVLADSGGAVVTQLSCPAPCSSVVLPGAPLAAALTAKTVTPVDTSGAGTSGGPGGSGSLPPLPCVEGPLRVQVTTQVSGGKELVLPTSDPFLVDGSPPDVAACEMMSGPAGTVLAVSIGAVFCDPSTMTSTHCDSVVASYAGSTQVAMALSRPGGCIVDPQSGLTSLKFRVLARGQSGDVRSGDWQAAVGLQWLLATAGSSRESGFGSGSSRAFGPEPLWPLRAGDNVTVEVVGVNGVGLASSIVPLGTLPVSDTDVRSDIREVMLTLVPTARRATAIVEWSASFPSSPPLPRDCMCSILVALEDVRGVVKRTDPQPALPGRRSATLQLSVEEWATLGGSQLRAVVSVACASDGAACLPLHASSDLVIADNKPPEVGSVAVGGARPGDTLSNAVVTPWSIVGLYDDLLSNSSSTVLDWTVADGPQFSLRSVRIDIVVQPAQPTGSERMMIGRLDGRIPDLGEEACSPDSRLCSTALGSQGRWSRFRSNVSTLALGALRTTPSVSWHLATLMAVVSVTDDSGLVSAAIGTGPVTIVDDSPAALERRSAARSLGYTDAWLVPDVVSQPHLCTMDPITSSGNSSYGSGSNKAWPPPCLGSSDGRLASVDSGKGPEVPLRIVKALQGAPGANTTSLTATVVPRGSLCLGWSFQPPDGQVGQAMSRALEGFLLSVREVSTQFSDFSSVHVNGGSYVSGPLATNLTGLAMESLSSTLADPQGRSGCLDFSDRGAVDVGLLCVEALFQRPSTFQAASVRLVCIMAHDVLHSFAFIAIVSERNPHRLHTPTD